jgi:hypothetical protein
MLTMLGLVIFDMYCLFEQTKVITLQNVTFTVTLKINLYIVCNSLIGREKQGTQRITLY